LVPNDPRNVIDRSLGARIEVEHRLGEDVLLRGGGSAEVDAYSVTGQRYVDPDLPQVQQFERVFRPRTDHTTGLWLDFVYDVTPEIEVTPGVRADLYASGSALAFGVDPRLSARAVPTPGVRILSAAGLAHQRPSFVVPLPGVAPVLGRGLQRSLQTSAGAELDLAEATAAGATLFYNAFFNATDAFTTVASDEDADLDLRTGGEAYGVELSLQRRLSMRLGGLLAYTLSRSVRRIGNREFVSGFDRTHVVNAALSYDLGRGWLAGGRILYYTGTPVWESDSIGTTSVDREPSFLRVDVRLEKRWRLGEETWIAFVAEFLNATLQKETWPGGERVGPVSIPSLGVEVGF
jgi:hypothetical protein